MLRASLLVILSLLATLTYAQDVTPPTLTSVTQSANRLFVVISWTSTYQCTGYCYFQVFRDNDIMIDTLADDGPGSYDFPLYFGAGDMDLTYGTHSFYVVAYDFLTAAPSNVIGGTYEAPAPVNPGPGDIVGDPQFMGLKGQLYQVHGAPNEVFSIISDIDLQYNSKFVYLDKGDCPTSNGEAVDTACFTHPGTYLGELGLETSNGDRVYIKAGGAAYGFAKVELNGQRVEIDQLIDLAPNGFLIRNSSHVLTMQAGNFRLVFINSDSFVNQIVEMIDTSRTTSHGLLGQSWSTKVHNPKATIPWIEGTVWDYAVEDHKVFSDKFTFNKFVSSGKQQDKKITKDVKQPLESTIQKLKQQSKDRLLKRKN